MNRIDRHQVPLYGLEGRFERINQQPVMFPSLLNQYNMESFSCLAYYQIFRLRDYSERWATLVLHWSHGNTQH